MNDTARPKQAERGPTWMTYALDRREHPVTAEDLTPGSTTGEVASLSERRIRDRQRQVCPAASPLSNPSARLPSRRRPSRSLAP